MPFLKWCFISPNRVSIQRSCSFRSRRRGHSFGRDAVVSAVVARVLNQMRKEYGWMKWSKSLPDRVASTELCINFRKQVLDDPKRVAPATSLGKLVVYALLPPPTHHPPPFPSTPPSLPSRTCARDDHSVRARAAKMSTSRAGPTRLPEYFLIMPASALQSTARVLEYYCGCARAWRAQNTRS